MADQGVQTGGGIDHVITQVDVIAADHQQNLARESRTGPDPPRQILVQAAAPTACGNDVAAVALVMRLAEGAEQRGRVVGQ